MQYKQTGKLMSCIFLLVTIISPGLSRAQTNSDTLKLTVQQAEEIFLQKNLTLLASQYNVEINKALVQQAKVWDNPTLSTDQTLYDGKIFRHTKVNGVPYGEVYIQLQQVIRTAGKRNKLIQLSQDNVLTAEAQFTDVMRNLKYILTTDLNNLNQLQNIASIYKSEMMNLQTLVAGMDEMLKIGDVSQKDNVRIKALLFSLQSDYTDNIRQQQDLQNEIRTMLQLSHGVWIIADAGEKINPLSIKQLSIGSLQDSALISRPDLNLARKQLLLQQHNLSYQKSLVVPDLTVGVEYDRLNSYTPNYYGLAISLPLPLFNRNKGNISAAQTSIKQADVVVKQSEQQVNNDVFNAWQKLITTTDFLSDSNTSFQSNYDFLLRNMIDSYKKRQVSLIEFIDFFDSWKETRMAQLSQINNQRNAAAELNYTINQNIVTL